jgi:hypothetical protein
MTINSTVAFAAGAVVALVLGSGTAYAATGGTFKLGRANSATSASSLTNSHGTALVLRSKAGQPSLKVNRSTKVPNLNADLVDGVSSGSLARVVRVGTVTGTGIVDDNGSITPTDDVIIAVAECPAGSQVLGGGVEDLTDDGVTYISIPDTSGGTDAWVAITDADPATNDAEDLIAFARCWNPRATVGNIGLRTTKRMISPSVEKVARKVAAQR